MMFFTLAALPIVALLRKPPVSQGAAAPAAPPAHE